MGLPVHQCRQNRPEIVCMVVHFVWLPRCRLIAIRDLTSPTFQNRSLKAYPSLNQIADESKHLLCYHVPGLKGDEFTRWSKVRNRESLLHCRHTHMLHCRSCIHHQLVEMKSPGISSGTKGVELSISADT